MQSYKAKLLLSFFCGSWRRKNSKESFEMAQRSVEQGCPRGYHCLGTRYDYGVGVAKDPVKAAELYKTGAELGSPECQYCYAVCFKNGSGVPQDDAAALEWAIKAAEQGHCAAAASISMESGNQPQPIMPVERIIGYLLKAEEKEPGDVRVAAQLAVQYINLDPSDFEKSIYWYDRAAELGDERASGMAHIYRYRQQLIDEGTLPEGIDAMDYLQFLQENDLVAEALSREPEKKEPQHDIDELLESIEDEDPDAIKAYAFACFVEGEGVYDHGVDKVRAKALLETLCETDPEAAGIMGLIEEDKDQAEKWLLKAAESGEAQFMKMLAQFYLDENEPFAEADKLDKALEWFEKAKEEDPEAEFYFDVLTYGKELFEDGELDEDASFFDILIQTHENAQGGDEAAEALTEKYSEIFDSFN